VAPVGAGETAVHPRPATSDGHVPDRAFCLAALPLVSRTFALSIRLLPGRLEYPVLIAYLLCRLADTIEDGTHLAPAEKQALLGHLSTCLEEGAGEIWTGGTAFAGAPGDEARLVREAARVLREFNRLPAPVRAVVRPWVQAMCAGMAEFIGRAASCPTAPAVFATVGDLERYCYYVAGTVGRLLTGLFQLETPGLERAAAAALGPLGESFGLGLQLTNIVKDVHDDRERGLIYLPWEVCRQHGISPQQLFAPEHRAAAGRVVSSLMDRARTHLDNGLAYCTALPSTEYRIRLFCLSALYFAARTLRRAAADPLLLEPGHKVKITRPEVYRTLAATALAAPSDTLIRRYYRALADT